MKPVLQTISDTGTPWGYSFWKSWMGCGKRALLDRQTPRPKGLCGNFKIDRGTVVHSLLEYWYRAIKEKGPKWADRITEFVIEWTDPLSFPEDYVHSVYQEANRIFIAYREAHDPGEFTEIVELEEYYEIDNFFQWPKFTFRPDMEVRLTKRKALAMDLPGAGIYTVDFKNWSTMCEFDPLYATTDLRFHCYTGAYDRAGPKRKGIPTVATSSSRTTPEKFWTSTGFSLELRITGLTGSKG